MIRLVQRRLIIPRGDTGSFSIPALITTDETSIAVFTIFDPATRLKVYEKQVAVDGDILTISFTHNDTVNLAAGNYMWDIKFYKNPVFVNNELVNGEEINSYYAGYSLPACEIRETGDSLLVSPESPTATLAPAQLDIISETLLALSSAVNSVESSAEHCPQIIDNYWYVWDTNTGAYVKQTKVREENTELNSLLNTPNEDGTYMLKVTVSSGTPTYSWESVTE